MQLKTNWQTLSELIDNKTTVFVTDRRGHQYQEFITWRIIARCGFKHLTMTDSMVYG